MPARLDHSKIHRPFKASGKPNYGLHEKPSSWYLLYYDKDHKTRSMCLYTRSVADARRMRDTLYSAAIANGRVPQSKLQAKCQHILDNHKDDHGGIHFVVCLGNWRIQCRGWEDAKKQQKFVAQQILLNKQPK